MRILVVEDDEWVAQAVQALLCHHNYAVDLAGDGETGWQMAEAFQYDLIVLDVFLPKLNGVKLCQKLRTQGYQMPILLLTGQDGAHQKAIALNAGVDDYVVKPFDHEELIARVQALLRRGEIKTPPVLTWGNLHLSPSHHSVIYGQQPLSLTPKEYGILELLLRYPRQVFSAAAIIDHAWTAGDSPGEEAVRVHIKGLRQKLKAVGAPPDLIETVYGVGYRLKQVAAIAPTLGEDGDRPTANEAESSQPPCHRILLTGESKFLTLLRSLLAPHAIQVHPLPQPEHLWTTLESCYPDLLVLDVENTSVDGFSLCQQIRQQARWRELPIIMLLPRMDLTLVQQAVAAGADDFISQPVAEAELMARIISRLGRFGSSHAQSWQPIGNNAPILELCSDERIVQ